ncbi:peptidase inhibitor family I36 protein [Nonomuraea longicatena]|uniref:Peptidase inhibitor family I36 n=1 Tax=Nonomuraea longicatena TaxID=83682 RepID=A0ABP4B5A6_9ACTN
MRLSGAIFAGLLAAAALVATSGAASAEDPSPTWTPAPISDDPSVEDNPTDATAANRTLIEAGQHPGPQAESGVHPLTAAAPDWALSCPNRSWCVWTGINGTGYRAAPTGNVRTFSATFRNNDWSAYNNGTSGASVAVYDLTSYRGHLYSQPQYHAWGYLNPGGRGESMRWI